MGRHSSDLGHQSRGARTGIGVVLAALLISACSGGSDPDGAGPSMNAGRADDTTGDTILDTTVVDTTVDESIEPAEDPEELAAEILALPETERNEAIAALGMRMQLAAAAESGLAEELGGADATRDALAAAWAPIIDDLMARSATLEPEGFRRPAAATPPSIGEGLFGGFVVSALGGGVAARAGREATVDKPISDTKDGLTVVGTLNHGELSLDVTRFDEKTGVTTSLKSKIVIMPCPDANGHFEVEGEIDVIVASATASQRAVIRSKVVGEVDDNAHLASSTITGETKWTTAEGAPLASSAADAIFESLLGQSLLNGARQSWESGGCVRIDVTGAGEVKTNAVVDVTAAPRSQIDGAPTGGTVTATFSGGLTAEPLNSPLDADATFVYTAPADSGSGTLTFESRSRRGVGTGTAQMHATAANFVITGSGGEAVFSGTASSPDVTWYATGTFPGGSAEFYFSSDIDAEGNRLPTGVVTVTGGGNGVTITGSGTYTMVGNQDGTYTVEMQEHSCVHVPGPLPKDVCRDNSATLTLTPEY